MVVEGIIDTSIIIDFLRRHPPARDWLLRETIERFAITPVVWMETIQGAANKIELDRALRFLHQFSVEHPTPADNEWAMQQLAYFHLSHNVGFQDVMIASVAFRLQVPLYTINVKHFSPLPSVIAQRPY